MAFKRQIIEDAWRRSRGYCECMRTSHHHTAPHNLRLDWAYRGRQGMGNWEAYSVSGEYKESVHDCLILCHDCYEAMR